MILSPMRFNGFTWHHNPKEITIYCNKENREQFIPYKTSELQLLGRKNKVVTGTGELYGEDCLNQFALLWQLFLSKETGILSIPDLPPFMAQFEYLSLEEKSMPDVITYKFRFKEVRNKDLKSTGHCYHTVLKDENLWDISYDSGISIENLVELNPSIKRPDELIEGERVKIFDN